ncbi:MAG: hypothetical protein JNL10_00105 [Verrucomicrobiales bacterium]|nr:hypothetical protein [Verrucomicrobiales bacterium]
MKSLFLAGLVVITAMGGSAQPFDIVLHFGDPPVVVDRTPRPGPGVNERHYAPGHPGANSLRFPLSEFEIVVLDPGVAVGSTETVRGVSLVRSRITSSPGPVGPPQHGGETFRVLLTATNGEALSAWKESGSSPATFPPGVNSKLSYDFSDPAYIPGGGLFGGGGPGGWDTTVRAYDVPVVSFELVPGAPPEAPPLFLQTLYDSLFLAWTDRWSTFIAEEAESIAGPWRPRSVQPKSIDDGSRVGFPAEAPRFFRLRPRPGAY